MMVFMPRYGAIDIGSNSLRMLIAEVVMDRRKNQPSVANLHADRTVTRLGESVFRSGSISEEAMDVVTTQLKRMASDYQKLGVSAVRAVATAAVRDASNRQEFLERASEAAGAPVEIISGQEEARLIHLGVQLRWPHPRQRILVIDVGGGSAELILSEGGRLTAAFSKPLGALRLTEIFLRHDPPSEEELHQLDKFIEEKLATPLERIGTTPFSRVIATSASAAAIVCAVHRIPRARRDQADRLRATTPQMRKLYAELCRRDLGGRRKITGIGPRRAEIIIAGAAVFLRAVEAFGQRSMYYLSAGVRDGLIADLAQRGAGSELSQLNREQRTVVEGVARKFAVPMKHARKVAALARELFDGLRPLHKLAPEYGKLLEAAAYLHDVGHYVSDTSHHKHSQYLIENGDMPGFTDHERRLVATLARYHRKAMPSDRHAAFQSLDSESRRAVLLLAPVLRIADNLDRGHEQRVESVECGVRNGTVVLAIRSRSDSSLEQWAAERAGEAFREVYGAPLIVTRRRGA
jgi:exopolyphosphatase/guanosine-5'-triphosphate,3'-diphosphate pyrophosphatase